MIPMLEFEGILRRNQALQELLDLARTVVADGKITDADRKELLELLEDVAGEGEGASPEEWGKL